MRFVLAILLVASLTGCASHTDSGKLDFEAIELATPSQSQPLPENSATTPEYVLDSAAEIEVEDQFGDGSSVQIEYAKVGRGTGFLVIKTSQNQVLGLAPIDPQTQVISVVLTSKLTSSQELWAELRWDNGDGRFDPSSDPILVEHLGEETAEHFRYEVRNG